jgi:hypothetical protein
LRIENDLSGNPKGGYFNNDRFQEDIQCKTKQVFRWYRGQYSEQHLYAADVAYAQNCNDGVYCAFDDRPSKLVIKSEPIKAKKYPGITIEPTIAILETLVTNPKRISWEDLSDAVNARCEADYLPAVIKTYTRMLEEIFRDKALDLRIFSDKTFVELDPKGRSEIFVVDRTG